MAINIGLSDEQRSGVIDMLNKALSDAYLLIIKTKKISLGRCGSSVSYAA